MGMGRIGRRYRRDNIPSPYAIEGSLKTQSSVDATSKRELLGDPRIAIIQVIGLLITVACAISISSW